MNRALFVSLIRQSLRDPRQAAEMIMGWQFDRAVLWTALPLVAMINTAAFILALQSSPPIMPMPVDGSNPLALFILLAGMLVIYVHAVHWAGIMVGGENGRLEDILAVLIWFQVLRAGAQVILVLCSLLLPALAPFLVLVIVFWGLWILLTFIKTACRVPSLGLAFCALLLAGVMVIVGLGILTSLIGGFL